MQKIILIAVDPGAKGGICIDYSACNSPVEAHKMPATPKDACDIITLAKETAEINELQIKCYMEEVGGYINGVGTGPAMFNFGRGFGQIEGMLTCLGIPFELVRPQKWQKALSINFPPVAKGQYDGLTDSERSDEKKRIAKLNQARKRDNKNHLKELAQRLYPHIKVTLDTADALLILNYGQKQV